MERVASFRLVVDHLDARRQSVAITVVALIRAADEGMRTIVVVGLAHKQVLLDIPLRRRLDKQVAGIGRGVIERGASRYLIILRVAGLGISDCHSIFENAAGTDAGHLEADPITQRVSRLRNQATINGSFERNDRTIGPNRSPFHFDRRKIGIGFVEDDVAVRYSLGRQYFQAHVQCPVVELLEQLGLRNFGRRIRLNRRTKTLPMRVQVGVIGSLRHVTGGFLPVEIHRRRARHLGLRSHAEFFRGGCCPFGGRSSGREQ